MEAKVVSTSKAGEEWGEKGQDGVDLGSTMTATVT